MTDSSSNPKEDSPFSSALTAIAKELKGNPVLLFTLGIAILLLAAGALAFENLRLILIGLLILTVLGLAAWLFAAVRKQDNTRSAWPTSIKSGDVNVANASLKKTNIGSGAIEVINASGDIQSGSIKVGKGSVGNSSIKSGDIKLGKRSK